MSRISMFDLDVPLAALREATIVRVWSVNTETGKSVLRSCAREASSFYLYRQVTKTGKQDSSPKQLRLS